MIDLIHTELATDEDRTSGIDTWAKLFKATTWEEIKMITKDNPSMNSTAESIYLSNSDFEIRERCRIREDAIIHEKLVAEKLEAQAETIATQAEEINRLKKLLADNGIQE